MKNNGSSGIGFTGMLTVLFIGLKLASIIDWDWIWVLSPIWISVAVYVPIILLILYLEAKKEIQAEREIEQYRINPSSKKSKFMEKLDEAMKASEEKKNQN